MCCFNILYAVYIKANVCIPGCILSRFTENRQSTMLILIIHIRIWNYTHAFTTQGAKDFFIALSSLSGLLLMRYSWKGIKSKMSLPPTEKQWQSRQRYSQNKIPPVTNQISQERQCSKANANENVVDNPPSCTLADLDDLHAVDEPN